MGISGDMNLAALIDLGVDQNYLLNELKNIHLQGYQVAITKEIKKGIHGTKVVVHTEPAPSSHSSLLVQSHQHQHVHRGMKEIRELITKSKLNDHIKSMSLHMFNLIAEAEGQIHNKSVDEVHFHEVGAVDSIVDIVGAAICLDFLKPDKIMSSSVQLGGGMVKCEHGLFPVPAPATAEILKGKPVKQGAVSFETTTPTGAAILAANANEFGDVHSFSIEKIGYGLGHKDADIPNVLRVFWANDDNHSTYVSEKQMMLETNIDDMSPESYDAIMQILFDHGALDVTLTPVIMKKSRPAITLSVLCAKDKLDVLADIVLKQTTSIGVRYYEVIRQILERKIESIDTPYGKVRVKLSGSHGLFFKAKPEYEDCVRISKETNKSISLVMSELQQLSNQLLK